MYTVHILHNKDFDELPRSVTRGSDISDSLGFADQRTGQAYVRYVGLPELQRYLVGHELEELEQHESTHQDENGIRHKKFRQAAANVGAIALPIIGNALLPGAGGVIGGALGGGLKAGIGGEKRTFKGVVPGAAKGAAAAYAGSKLTGGFGVPSSAPVQGTTSAGAPITVSGPGGGLGFFGRLGASAKSGFGAGTAASNIGKFAKNPLGFFSGAGSAGTRIGSATKSAVQSGQLTPTPLVTGRGVGSRLIGSSPSVNPVSSLTQGGSLSKLFGGGGGGGDALGSDQSGSTLNLFKGLTSPQGLLGIAGLTAGLGKRLPRFENLPGSVDQLRGRVGGGPLSQSAKDVLLNQINQPFDPLSDEEITAATRQFEEQRADQRRLLLNQFKAVNPGAGQFENSELARQLGLFDESTSQGLSDIVAGKTREAEDRFTRNRAQAISQAAGLDQQDFQNLAQLANLDIQQIATNLNIGLEEAELVKQVATQLGQEFLLSSFDVNRGGFLNQLFSAGI